MVKRIIAMLATILIALAVGIGVGLFPTNPEVQVGIAAAGSLALWAIVTILSKNGAIWEFSAPYP
jgi:hypothetical protein